MYNSLDPKFKIISNLNTFINSVKISFNLFISNFYLINYLFI